MKIRVLIADDHVTVLEGLAAIIGRQADMEVIGQAADGCEAVTRWEALRPDITLLDLRMPVLDGLGALRKIREIDGGARLIVLTTYDTDNDILLAIKAGAKAYLLKDTRREELLQCIRAVHRGETYLSPAMLGKLAVGVSNETLTAREHEVLNLLAAGHGNKEIGVRLHIGETTVKSHLRSIFTKFGVVSRTEAIAVAVRRGLVQM